VVASRILKLWQTVVHLDNRGLKDFLESQGLLASEWRKEDKRNKRFYRLSRVGTDVFARLMDEWEGIAEAIRNLEGRHGSR